MKALLHSLLDLAVNTAENPSANPSAHPSAHPQSPLLGATLLVVGGGAGADLAHWRALQPQRLVVCEPQPALADELQRKLRADAGETLVRGAIAAADGPLTLQLLNNPRESGVQPPTGLLAHQPRLQVQATLAVPAQTLWQMAEALQLSADAPHLLVLDAPGQASAILQPSLAALQRFEWLVLRTGTEPLYAGDAPCTDLLAMLQAAAYDLVADEPQTLPPHRELLLRRNPQRLRALQTQAALAHARAALQQKQTDTAELAAVNASLEITLAEWVLTIERLETRNQTLAQQVAECQAEVAELTQAQQTHHELVRQQQAEWALERLSVLEAAASRKAEAEKVAGEQLAEINAARQAQSAAEDLAAQRQTQLATLTQELADLNHAHDEQARLAGEQVAQIAALQEAKAAAEQSAAQRQEQIDEMAHEVAELANSREQASQYQAEVAALTQSLQAHQELTQLQQDQWTAERLAQLESLVAHNAEADKAAVERSAQIHAMTQELAELAQAREQASRYQAEVAALTQSLQAHQETAQLQQDQWAAERLGHLELVGARNADADKAATEQSVQIQAMTQELVELANTRDKQAQLAIKYVEQIEAITQAKLAAESAAAVRQAQIDALGQEKANLLASQEALSKDKAELSQLLQTKVTACDEQVLLIKAAEAENRDLAARQQLMNDELLKAEAQIELIKDLLLREPGL